MRIGILIKKFDQLENWEFRIIERIILDKNLSLSLLIKDGRIAKKPISRKKNIISKFVFAAQKYIERKFFFKTINTVNRKHILKYLDKTPSVEVFPKRVGFTDRFNETDCKKIKKYDVDILLRHNFGIIRGEILNVCKHGIWSFHHGDNSVNRGGPPGFWEIVLNQKIVGVTLQKLTKELDGGLIIDKAYFNKHWSYIKTRDLIYEGSVSLLFKNLNCLRKGNVKYKPSKLYYNKLYKSPEAIFLIRYLVSFYFVLSKKTLQFLMSKFFKIRYYKWAIFIGHGDFNKSILYKVKAIASPKDEYWADPFLYKDKGKVYLFFENFCYRTKKGKISCGEFVDSKIKNVADVLDLDYHLSFPFIYKDGENLYMIPETHENKRLEVYKCVEFPKKWELYSTAFDGEKIGDPHIFKYKNELWLFLNKASNSFLPLDNELYIYKIDSLKLKKIIPHEKNPVLIDSRIARNAGNIFVNDGVIYRPSQANIDGIYGKNLNINEIKKLSLKEYSESKVLVAKPNFRKNMHSIHHVSQIDNIYAFDAAYKLKF